MSFDARHQRATPATHTGDTHRPRTASGRRHAHHHVGSFGVLPRAGNGSHSNTHVRPTTSWPTDRDTPATETIASQFGRVGSNCSGDGPQ
jgi:hypothetical protein